MIGRRLRKRLCRLEPAEEIARPQPEDLRKDDRSGPFSRKAVISRDIAFS